MASVIRLLSEAYALYKWPSEEQTSAPPNTSSEAASLSPEIEAFSVCGCGGRETYSVHKFDKADLAVRTHRKSLQMAALLDWNDLDTHRVANASRHESTWREQLPVTVKIISNLFYPQMLRLYHTFEDAQHFYCVTERAGECTLAQFLQNRGRRLDEDTAIYFTKQLLSVVVEAHKDVHNTLTYLIPEELLIQGCGKRPKLKLNLVRHTWLKVKREAQELAACDAPEEDEPNHANFVASDMWRVGLIVYMMLCGMPTAHAQESTSDPKARARTIIINVKSSFEDRLWQGVSSEARDFVKQLLWREPHKRLSPAKAFHHPWIEGGRLCLFDLTVRYIVKNGGHFARYASKLPPLLVATLEEAGIEAAISRSRRSRQVVSLWRESKTIVDPEANADASSSADGETCFIEEMPSADHQPDPAAPVKMLRWKSATVNRDSAPRHADVLTSPRGQRGSMREEPSPPSPGRGESPAQQPRQRRSTRQTGTRRTTRSLSSENMKRKTVQAGARLSPKEEQDLACLNSEPLISRTASWSLPNGESGLTVSCSIADRMFSPNESVSLRVRVEQKSARSVAVERIVACLQPIGHKSSRALKQQSITLDESFERLSERLFRIPLLQHAGLTLADDAWATDWTLVVKLNMPGGHARIKLELPVTIIPGRLYL